MQSADVILPVDLQADEVELAGDATAERPVLELQRIDLASWTAYNTGVATVAAGTTHGLKASLGAGSASATPDAAGGLHAPIEEALRRSGFVIDQTSDWRMFLGSLSHYHTDFTDAYMALVAYNDGGSGGAPTAATEGLGVGLHYEATAGLWMPTVWHNNGTGWSFVDPPGATPGTTPDTEAAMLEVVGEQFDDRWVATALAYSLGLDFVGGVNQSTADAGTNILDGPMTRVAFCAGRISTGGSAVDWEFTAAAKFHDWQLDTSGVIL